MRGSSLRKLRHRLGLTQAQMGKAIGRSRNTVSRYETEVRPIPLWLERAARDLQRERRGRR